MEEEAKSHCKEAWVPRCEELKPSSLHSVIHLLDPSKWEVTFPQNSEALLQCSHGEGLWYGDCSLCVTFLSPLSAGFGTFWLLAIHWNFLLTCPGMSSFSFTMLIFHWCFWPRDPVLWFVGMSWDHILDHFLSTFFSTCWNSCYLDVGPLNRSSNFLNFFTLVSSYDVVIISEKFLQLHVSPLLLNF